MNRPPLKITLRSEEINKRPPACGACSLCCLVMAIEEGYFHKPKDVWCMHAKKGCGCTIYPERPTKCVDFKCLWLQGLGDTPYEKRPDKVHGFFTTTTDGKNLVLHEDPGYPGFARTALKPEIEHWLDHGAEYYVIVVCGSKRSFFGDVRTFAKLQQADTPEVTGARDVTTEAR